MVEAAICFFVVVVMLLNGKDMILGCVIKRFFFLKCLIGHIRFRYRGGKSCEFVKHKPGQ